MGIPGRIVEIIGEGLSLYRHQRVPANDEGIALEQAVLADVRFGKDEGG